MQTIQILCDLLPENCQYLFCCSPHGDIIMSEKVLCRSNFFIYFSKEMQFEKKSNLAASSLYKLRL